jgi:predicted aldo/keto reductase-like oxidoreductase
MTSIAALTKEPGSPRRCNGCGICEKNCPQFIEIRKMLKKTGRRFEPLPIRAVMSLARKIMVK